MDQATVALLILAGSIALFVWNRLPVGSVAILTTLALWATGLVTTNEAVAGFGDPVVVFIATLFVVSEAIDSTGVTTWAGQVIMRRAGTRRTPLLIALSVLAAILASFITLNGATAALIPLVVLLAHRMRDQPSQWLMPVVFGGSAGGMLMLMSSPVNVIVSEASQDAGAGPFAFFSFGLLGVPLLVGTIAISLLFGRRLLPHVQPAQPPPDLARHAHTLEEQYALTDGFYHLRVRSRSPLVGAGPRTMDLASYPTVTVSGAQRGAGSTVTGPLQDDDVLIVTGPGCDVTQFAMDNGLAMATTGVPGSGPEEGDGALLTREAGLAEVVVPPRSSLVGQEVYPGMVRDSGLVILAVQHRGRTLADGPVELAEGDAIVVHGRWSALDALCRDRDVLVVDPPEVVRRQALAWGPKATQAVLVLGALVVMLASGLVPPAIAGLIAAVAIVLLKVVSAPQAYRAVSWQTVVLVGGLIPLSTALQSSGAAEQVSQLIIDAVGPGRPYLLLLALFLLTAVLGQVVSNTATVLVVTPIAVAAAQATHTSVQPVLMLVAVAGGAALLTPIATPGNMMIMNPAGYRFGDYWKLGLPIMVWYLVVALAVIPLVWPF